MFDRSQFVCVLCDCFIIGCFLHFWFSFFLFEQASERLISTLLMYLAVFSVSDFFVFSVFYIAALVWASTAGGFGIFSSWKWQCAYNSVGGFLGWLWELVKHGIDRTDRGVDAIKSLISKRLEFGTIGPKLAAHSRVHSQRHILLCSFHIF